MAPSDRTEDMQFNKIPEREETIRRIGNRNNRMEGDSTSIGLVRPTEGPGTHGSIGDAQEMSRFRDEVNGHIARLLTLVDIDSRWARHDQPLSDRRLKKNPKRLNLLAIWTKVHSRSVAEQIQTALVGRLPVHNLGRSQFGLLHLGQTRGRSASRGSHSCPHRHRQPTNGTIPIGFSSRCSFATAVSGLSILPEVYTRSLD